MNYPWAETWPRTFSIHSFIPLYLILGTKKSKRRGEEKTTCGQENSASSPSWQTDAIAIVRGIRESGYEKRKDAGVTRVVSTKRSRRERSRCDTQLRRGGTPRQEEYLSPRCATHIRETRGSKEADSRARARVGACHKRRPRATRAKDFLSSILDARFSRSKKKI